MEPSENSPKILYNDMLEAIEGNRLPLPTQPDIAIQIQEISKNPNVTIEDLNDVIGRDPGLTARIIRIANSPLMRGQVAITTLKIALSRLGTQFVANMAIGIAMEQLFNARNKIVDEMMRDAWRTCGEVACVSYVIANYTKICLPEEAMLAGLLQDFGLLPILTYADKHKKLLDDLKTLELLLVKYSPKLGTAILTSWQFPRELANVPVNVSNLTRVVPRGDISDIVLVSKIHVFSNSNHPLAAVDIAEIPSYERLGLPQVRHLNEIPGLEAPMENVTQVFD